MARPPLKTGHSMIVENKNTKLSLAFAILGLTVAIAGAVSYMVVWKTYYSELGYKEWRNTTYRKIGIVIMVMGGLLLVIALVFFLRDTMVTRKHVSHHRRTLSSVSTVSSDGGMSNAGTTTQKMSVLTPS